MQGFSAALLPNKRHREAYGKHRAAAWRRSLIRYEAPQCACRGGPPSGYNPLAPARGSPLTCPADQGMREGRPGKTPWARPREDGMAVPAVGGNVVKKQNRRAVEAPSLWICRSRITDKKTSIKRG